MIFFVVRELKTEGTCEAAGVRDGIDVMVEFILKVLIVR